MQDAYSQIFPKQCMVQHMYLQCQSDGSQLSGMTKIHFRQHSDKSWTSWAKECCFFHCSFLLLTSHLKLTIPEVQGTYNLCKTQFLELPGLSDRSECVKPLHQPFMHYFTSDTRSNPRIWLYLPVMTHFMPMIHAHCTHQSNVPCFCRSNLCTWKPASIMCCSSSAWGNRP